MRKLITITTFITLLIACGTLHDFSKVKRGMTAEEVTKVAGAPDDRTFKGKGESWYYYDNAKIVVLRNGKVIALRKDYTREKRKHDLAKAKAGATKININTRRSRGWKAHHPPTKCWKNNFHGQYAKGGGCNMNGCWQKGGSCNFHGCTKRGECTIHGCPSGTESFKCTK